MAYDIKFREKVIKFMEKGHTIEKAHEVFEVGTTTIKRWRKLNRELGDLRDKPANRNPEKICPTKLKAVITEKPDIYQSELAEIFKCTQGAISHALKRLKIRRKKNS